MKVEVKESKSKEIKYPCLMKSESDGTVVLFKDVGEGTVLSSGSNCISSVGNYIKCWRMENFTPFYGTITLQND